MRASDGGVAPATLLAEVRDTHAYRDITPDEWQWTLDFVPRGGAALSAYPEFRRVDIGDDGKLTYVRKYDIDVGDTTMFWMGMVPL